MILNNLYLLEIIIHVKFATLSNYVLLKQSYKFALKIHFFSIVIHE